MRFERIVFGLLFLASLAAATNCNGSVNADLTLDSDVNAIGNTSCFNVTANGVTIDCAGHEIYGDSLGVHDGNFTIGVNATNVDDFTLKNCIIRAVHYGVQIDNVDDSTIYNNTLWNMTGRGAHLESETNSLNFSYNNVSYTDRYGVYLNAISKGLNFSNNRIHNNGFSANKGAIYVKAANSTFDNNNISYTRGYTLYVNTGNQNVFSRNYVANNGSIIFWLQSSDDAVIEFNEFHQTAGDCSGTCWGIYDYQNNQANVSYNYFDIGKRVGIQSDSSSTAANFYNNTFVNQQDDGILSLSQNTNVSYNAFINYNPNNDSGHKRGIGVGTDRGSTASIWVGFNSFTGSSSANSAGKSAINLEGDYTGYSCDGCTVYNNTIATENLALGIIAHRALNSNISYNTVTGNSNTSLYLFGKSETDANLTKDNVIHDNYLSSSKGIYLNAHTTNNTFYDNRVYNGSDYFVNNSNSSNYFNNSAGHGNYYADISSFAIYDYDFDGYGETGSDWPYNSSQTYWIGEGADYGPKESPFPYFMTAAPTLPADNHRLTVTESITFTGSCETNTTLAGAAFWLFRNGAVYLALANTSGLTNATAFSRSFTAPIEVMDLTWKLECTGPLTLSGNSTDRTLSLVGVGGSGSSPTATPTDEPTSEPAASPTAAPTTQPTVPAPGGEIEPSQAATASPVPSEAPSSLPSTAAVSRGEAEALLNEVENSMAGYEGEVPDEAVLKLQMAKDAFASGEYSLAEQYAAEARNALGVAPSVEPDGGDDGSLGLIASALLVLGLGAAGYYYLKAR